MTTRAERPRLHVTPTYAYQEEPFPYPATTLVVSQHLFISHDSRCWAWLITGTFYDAQDKAVWGTEVFLAMNPEDESGGGDERPEESAREGTGEDESEGEIQISDSSSDSGYELPTGARGFGVRVSGGGHRTTSGGGEFAAVLTPRASLHPPLVTPRP